MVCIGDAHDSPDIPNKSRFRWMAEYIRQEKPDIVIQIGDFATLDSLNSHVGNETYGGKSKPTFMADMESFNNALGEMELDGIEHHVTLGNHERRLFLFEERAPEAYGMMQCELQKVFERHNQSANPNVRYSEVLDAGEADEPLTVDHFVFVQILKKWGPHGASQNGITVTAL